MADEREICGLSSEPRGGLTIKAQSFFATTRRPALVGDKAYLGWLVLFSPDCRNKCILAFAFAHTRTHTHAEAFVYLEVFCSLTAGIDLGF